MRFLLFFGFIRPSFYAAALGASILLPIGSAQQATQVKLTNPNSGAGTPFSVNSNGRQNSNHVLTRSTEFNGDVATATNTTNWDLNPAAGSMQISSTSSYLGWAGSGVSLDTRYVFAVFDTFTINAGDSGLAAGTNVQLTLNLDISISAATDGLNAQTASNFMKFTVQQRDPVQGAFGAYDSDELFSLQYDVTVYNFVQKAIVGGVTQLDVTTPYANGQGDEMNVYNFDITLAGQVGETIELGMLFGDFNPVDYDYTLDNLVTGTRQDIGNSQTDYGNEFAATINWDFEEIAGFEGLEIEAASGFASAMSAVPEPSTFAALLGVFSLGLCASRRSRRRSKNAILIGSA